MCAGINLQPMFIVTMVSRLVMAQAWSSLIAWLWLPPALWSTLRHCSICLCNSVFSSAQFPLVSDDEQVWAQNYRGRPRNKQFLRFCLLTWREDDATFAHENLPIFRPIWFFFGRYLMKALEDNQHWTFRPSIYFYYQVSPLQCSMVTQITSWHLVNRQ